MDTVFTLPLSLAAAIQVLIAMLLLMPRVMSLPLSIHLSKARSNTAAVSVFYTICILLAGLLFISGAEVMRGADHARRGDARVDLVATIDYLRAQISCVLCMLNLLLCLLLPKLADEVRKLDSSTKNLDAMKRQVSMHADRRTHMHMHSASK